MEMWNIVILCVYCSKQSGVRLWQSKWFRIQVSQSECVLHTIHQIHQICKYLTVLYYLIYEYSIQKYYHPGFTPSWIHPALMFNEIKSLVREWDREISTKGTRFAVYNEVLSNPRLRKPLPRLWILSQRWNFLNLKLTWGQLHPI
jgi:hypothetical protein